jgi:RNA polymerase sigma-70 factor (ECF subfamily)
VPAKRQGQKSLSPQVFCLNMLKIKNLVRNDFLIIIFHQRPVKFLKITLRNKHVRFNCHKRKRINGMEGNKDINSDNRAPEPALRPDIEQIFHDYYARLVFFSHQIVGHKAIAEDLTQEAFIKYWHQQEALAPDKTAIKNFLYSAVKHASLNTVRHDKVVARFIHQADLSEGEEAPIMQALIRAEVLAELYRALESLPESCRKISCMGYLEGLKNHEIAQELGISVNTVKTQKQRGMHLLRLKLNPELFVLFLPWLLHK